MTKPTHLIEFEAMLLGRHLANINSRKRGRHSLDRSAYTVLSRISMQGPMSIGQLSDALDLDSSTLNRQTSAMTAAGLVERIPDPDGGMARKFRITSSGEEKLAAERAHGVAALERVLTDWSEDEVATFARWLERFNNDIERLTGHPWPRPTGSAVHLPDGSVGGM
ncbi:MULTISPECIES: MarR family winged helix-turn-helix transcriptional regulator [Rhodococcus]|uniref:MarR family winged helix-turn-helix transcriptional regulator n=1 Tax=Rhodococcus TaxID=1827 RepID=UPI001021C79E|nr:MULTISPECIES: MarR family winged helix-turn-helix transcriptional regulator [Rhodococcus]UTT49152.1 MarR family winged helix-turn-helix transcriptional regulator [Rhodococcus gordoniae]